jgi:hypothetical protein
MALSITELELQSTEYLPAREVMTSFGRRGGPGIHQDSGHTVDGSDGNEFQGGILNGINLQDIATDINVEEIQVSLVNVLLEDFQDTLDLGTYNNDQDAIVED